MRHADDAIVMPAGELATVEMGQLLLRIVPVASPETILLEGTVDAELGIDLGFDVVSLAVFVGDGKSGVQVGSALRVYPYSEIEDGFLIDFALEFSYALGIKERLAMLWEEETLFSESTRVFIDAMAQNDVRRLVVVTGFGAGRSRSATRREERH